MATDGRDAGGPPRAQDTLLFSVTEEVTEEDNRAGRAMQVSGRQRPCGSTHVNMELHVPSMWMTPVWV